MNILVIDDDRSVGMAIQALLNREGYQALLVESGLLGIQAFDASRFDGVLVDLFMPAMSGLETIGMLRQRSASVPIIAMSGFSYRNSMAPTRDLLKMATALGATSCLRKPFRPHQLVTAVQQHLDPSPARTRDTDVRQLGISAK